MAETQNTPAGLRQWLFNPFQFVAGLKALLIGLAIILISAFLGSLNTTHFDGALDVHIGQPAPALFFFAEGLIDWICVSIPLFLLGLIVSRSSLRVVDVFGTQALARWPYLITSLVMLPGANRRFAERLVPGFSQAGSPAPFSSADLLVFALAMFLSLLMLIWMVALMYRAYAVSCNVKGAKAIITFIVGLVIAEVLSKLAIIAIGCRVIHPVGP